MRFFGKKSKEEKVDERKFLVESDYFSMRQQRNWLLFIVTFLLIVILALVVLFSVLAKWSGPVPFLLRLDESNGLTEIQQPYEPGSMTIPEDELYLESVLSQYIIRRERYYPEMFAEDQTHTHAYSSANAKAGYSADADPGRSGSLAGLLKEQGRARVKIRSVQRSKTQKNTFQVRWFIEKSLDGLTFGPKEPFISYVVIRLEKPPTTPLLRYLNPFGVKVYEYNADQESS